MSLPRAHWRRRRPPRNGACCRARNPPNSCAALPRDLAAAGLLAAPIAHEASGSFHSPLESTDLGAVRALLAELDACAEELMQAEQIDGLRRERRTFADVGYMGQSHFIEVPLNLEADDPLAALYASFEAAHERLNGHKTGAPAKIVNCGRFTSPGYQKLRLVAGQDSLQARPSKANDLSGFRVKANRMPPQSMSAVFSRWASGLSVLR